MTFNAIVSDIRLLSRHNGRATWQIALDRNLPDETHAADITLTARSPTGAVLIAEVFSATCDEDGRLWLVTEKPLPMGTEVTITLRG